MSTKVGGIPEVLPPDMIILSMPTVPGERSHDNHMSVLPLFPLGLVSALDKAIECHHCGNRVSHQDMHLRVKEMYRWEDVAERTERVSAPPPIEGGVIAIFLSGI